MERTADPDERTLSRRMTAEAASMLQHAGFTIRNRDIRRRDSES
jgi:hypothetical protein